jgi:hypothetical protein
MSAAKRRVPVWVMTMAMGVIFFGLAGYAKWAGYWDTNIPSQVYREYIPRAAEFGHP